MDFWEYHEKGNHRCEACYSKPAVCENCQGLVHSDFDKELEKLRVKCESCSSPNVTSPED